MAHDDHHHVHFDSPEAAGRAEREAEALAPLLDRQVAALAAAAPGDVRRVLDLGSGPGVGTCALAARFPEATVVAVDGSATMLERARARADRLGLGGRVETRLASFPDDLDALGRADVAWSSMALHHVGDEADALGRIRELLAPGGLLALVEVARPLRVVADDLGRPGLADRLDAAWGAWFADMRSTLPGHTASTAYPDLLRAAGYEVVADELLDLELAPPLPPGALDLAREHRDGTRHRLEGHADPDDLAALEAVPDDALVVGAQRHLLLAQPSTM